MTSPFPRFPVGSALVATMLACTAGSAFSATPPLATVSADACVVAVRSATTDMLLLDADAMRLAGKIRSRLLAGEPSGARAGQSIDIAITNYDKGSNTVRSMVRGPNDVHADMTVTVRSASDPAASRSLQLRETFSGIVVDGSSSRIGDIEDALVKAVAEALRQG